MKLGGGVWCEGGFGILIRVPQLGVSSPSWGGGTKARGSTGCGGWGVSPCCTDVDLAPGGGVPNVQICKLPPYSRFRGCVHRNVYAPRTFTHARVHATPVSRISCHEMHQFRTKSDGFRVTKTCSTFSAKVHVLRNRNLHPFSPILHVFVSRKCVSVH